MTTHQSLALGFFIAIGLVVGVCGERFEVTSAQQLIKLLNISEANHFDANIVLLDDLDFSDSALTLPLGLVSETNYVPYTGVFEGNGHTIKNLVMDNTEDPDAPFAGLFFGIGDATVQDLVIDSSCSFAGIYAGTLSTTLTGSLTLTNVMNKATVYGLNEAGGFVAVDMGSLHQVNQVTIKNCVNDGTITGKLAGGAFISEISEQAFVTVTLSDSINNGNITGNCCTGGLVGTLQSSHVTMIISNCTNNGNVTTETDFVGGLTGFIYENGNITINISSFINNGFITGREGAGGFIGYIGENNNETVTIYNSMNTGEITGRLSAIGGLIGGIDAKSETFLNTLSIINSVNKGNVSSNRIACGMFCINPDYMYILNTTVINSVNKGGVNGTANAYGITNIITKARNVVSMGEINSYYILTTFWNMSTDTDLIFGLDGKCFNCPDNTTIFVHNTNTGFYDVVESGEHVHDLFNAEAEKQNYGMLWTEELELMYPHTEPSPSPSPLPSSSPSSQSGGLSGGSKHGVSLFLISVVITLAAHVAMTQ